jgi:hypothetical protein
MKNPDSTGGSNAASAFEELKANLTRLKEIYTRVSAVAGRQKEILAQANMDAFYESMAEYRELFERAKDAEAAAVAGRESWPTLRATLSEGSRKEIETLIGDLKELMGGLMKTQTELGEMAQTIRDKTGGEIKKIADTRKAGQAYQQNKKASDQPRFFDTKE